MSSAKTILIADFTRHVPDIFCRPSKRFPIDYGFQTLLADLIGRLFIGVLLDQTADSMLVGSNAWAFSRELRTMMDAARRK